MSQEHASPRSQLVTFPLTAINFRLGRVLSKSSDFALFLPSIPTLTLGQSEQISFYHVKDFDQELL